MTRLRTALAGFGGFALGVAVTTAVEIRKPDDVTVLVTDRNHLSELDQIIYEANGDDH